MLSLICGKMYLVTDKEDTQVSIETKTFIREERSISGALEAEYKIEVVYKDGEIKSASVRDEQGLAVEPERARVMIEEALASEQREPKVYDLPAFGWAWQGDAEDLERY